MMNKTTISKLSYVLVLIFFNVACNKVSKKKNPTPSKGAASTSLGSSATSTTAGNPAASATATSTAGDPAGSEKELAASSSQLPLSLEEITKRLVKLKKDWKAAINMKTGNVRWQDVFNEQNRETFRAEARKYRAKLAASPPQEVGTQALQAMTEEEIGWRDYYRDLTNCYIELAKIFRAVENIVSDVAGQHPNPLTEEHTQAILNIHKPYDIWKLVNKQDFDRYDSIVKRGKTRGNQHIHKIPNVTYEEDFKAQWEKKVKAFINAIKTFYREESE